MADDKANWTAEQKILDGLITQVEAHQVELELGDTPFVARYAQYLRSAKTWRDRMIERNWREIGVPKAIERMRALVDRINGMSFVRAKINEKMPITAYALAAYEMMDSRSDDRRVSWLIGPTGVGKSWAMRAVIAKARGASAYIQTDSTWKDTMSAITGGIAKSVGVQYGYSAADTMRLIVDHLSETKAVLCVDDVQDMGVTGLKILKNLVDKSTCRLILGIYPTGWASLMSASTAARSEAHQLLGRSIKPVVSHWIKGIRPADAQEFMRGLGVTGNLKLVSERMAPHLQSGGNLRTLADAVEGAQAESEDQSLPVTAELVSAHVDMLLGRDQKVVL